MALGMLIKGKWTKDWTEHDSEGNFKRMETNFRSELKEVSEKDRGRYSLYASYGCPWAHRTIMAHQLFGLDEFIKLVIVEPHISENGWYFSKKHSDPNYDLSFLRDLYLKNDKSYTGRVTVPVLWDAKEETIVNNESSDILKILNSTFKQFSQNKELDLYPDGLQEEIEKEVQYNYEAINNACYRTGFAKSQEVYEKEVTRLFEELEKLDLKLKDKQYLIGKRLTAADLSLLPTLLRFDPAYYGIFKCNIKRLKDFPDIKRYKNSLLQNEKIKKTFKVGHIKSLYYKIEELNPSCIVPLGPDLGGM